MAAPEPIPFTTQIKALSNATVAPAGQAAGRQTVSVVTLKTVAPAPLGILAGTVTQLTLPYVSPSADLPAGSTLPAGLVATIVAQIYITPEDQKPIVNDNGTLTWNS